MPTDPDVNVQTGFCTHDAAHYLCADLGVNEDAGHCQLVADRTGCGVYETFELVPNEDDWPGRWSSPGTDERQVPAGRRAAAATGCMPTATRRAPTRRSRSSR